MKPKLILCLALVLSGGLFGCSTTKPHSDAADAGINVPIVAAPKMQECHEAKINDLGLWDDVFRFENLDSIILRRGDELFSYSLVTSDLKRIRTISDMTGSRILNGIAWGKHQWLFCQSDATSPFAIDLSTGNEVQFEIPEVRSSTIHAIITTGYKGGTVFEINGGGVAGWPRDGNRPLYFWMSLESGRMTKFPTGWDFNYFSADQRTAVFENPSTNAMEYRPLVPVDMETGTVIEKLPDQTKGLWSEPTMDFWEASVARYKNRQNVWQLRTPQTPMKLLKPQIGRGFSDDTFAGLSADGITYSLTMTNAKLDRCVDAKLAGNLAAFLLQPDGGIGNSLWVTQFKENETPTLLATNCSFEMLGDRRCAVITRNEMSKSLPESIVYDAKSKTAWNIFDGIPLWTNTIAVLGAHSWPQTTSGIGPMVSLRLTPGFGSARFPAQVLSLFSSMNIVSANMPPSPEFRQFILLTGQGERYQIKLPKNVSDLIFGRQFWVHNSGKLVVCEPEPPLNNSPKEQFHLLIAELFNRP
jgi:hypothetical protein